MHAPALPRFLRLTPLALAAMAALASASPARAQATPAALALRVIDGETGAPLAGASVRLDGLGSGVSDARGTLRLPLLAAGRHLLEVTMLGRRPAAPEVELIPGGELALEVVLNPDVLTLPGIAVTARMRDPRELAGDGGGEAAFRDRVSLLAALEVHAQALKELSAPVRDAVVPQVTGRLLADPTANGGPDGAGGEVCVPDLFIDGVAVEYSRAVYLGDLSLSPRDPEEDPPIFGEVTSKCGAILIWTTGR